MALTVEFFDRRTGGPIVSLSGPKAQWLFEHSQLLQTLVEAEPEEKHFQIPVDFPSDRVQIFRKLLKGIPVGELINTRNGIAASYDPLGPEEEANIQRNINEGRLNPENIYMERARVVMEVLQFLMLEPGTEAELIPFRKNTKNKNEQRRRERITRKRQQKGNNLGYLNEDTIDRLLENHKNLLYATHGYRGPEIMRTYMTKKNYNSRKKRQNNFEDRMVQESRRRAQARNRGNYNNWNNYNEQNISGPFDNVRNLFPYHSFENVNPVDMTSIEFERYLRSKLRKGEELALPKDPNYNVGNFFGNRNRI